MAYKYFRVEFNSIQELFDLKKPIEIFTLFIGNVGSSRIRGYNFNKYYDPNARIVHPYIEILSFSLSLTLECFYSIGDTIALRQ